jgi:hypothetical protein
MPSREVLEGQREERGGEGKVREDRERRGQSEVREGR